MNFRNALVLLTSAMVIGFAGCKKDDDDDAAATPTPPPAPTPVMTCKVNAVNWASISNRAAGSIVNNTSNLTGVATDSTVITMTVTENIELNGVYDLGPSSLNGGVFAPSTNGTGGSSWTSNAHPTSTGEMIVTAMDTVNKRISGTFHFKAWRATDNTFKDITNGVFTDVPYITSLTSTGSNLFSVKINNVLFTPASITGVVNSGDIMIIASDSQASQTVGITIPETATVGTHAMGSMGADYYGQYNPNGSTFTISTSGSVVITSHNTTTDQIVGTFSFNSAPLGGGAPTFNLTQGSFTINY